MTVCCMLAVRSSCIQLSRFIEYMYMYAPCTDAFIHSSTQPRTSTGIRSILSMHVSNASDRQTAPAGECIEVTKHNPTRGGMHPLASYQLRHPSNHNSITRLALTKVEYCLNHSELLLSLTRHYVSYLLCVRERYSTFVAI